MWHTHLSTVLRRFYAAQRSFGIVAIVARARWTPVRTDGDERTVDVPTMGDSITTGTISSWMKDAGDSVEPDEVVCVIETDKVSVDIRSPVGGTLTALLASEGEDVSVGAPLFKIKSSSGKSKVGKELDPNEAAKKEFVPKAENDESPEKSSQKEQVVDVPPMGDSISSGTIASWMKAEGDYAEVDEVICVVETDKVSVDIRTPVAGKISEQLAKEGEEIEVGAPLFRILPGKVITPVKAASKSEPEESKKSEPAPPIEKKASKSIEKASEPIPVAGGRGERRVAMTRMRQRIAERLKVAQNTAASLTTFNEVDMSALQKFRSTYKDLFQEVHGVKLGFMSAFVKAAVVALKDQPAVNAYIDGKDIVYHDYVDVSIAVSTPTGLVVPVLRNCESMSFAQVEKTIGEMGKKARDGQIALEDMAGGTFTISNGGVYGSLFGTPIINPPQSAILGMHGIFERPVVVNGAIEIRPMMYVALTYDHRIIDGREAVLFLRKIKDCIEDPRRMLLGV